ncbi:MAG: TatD family hydrolase [Myxococcales bacterium]|nr:TatD family hydrolase [Myxococcales bacterium]
MPASPTTSALPPLFDTHCHVAFDAFNEDREAVLERAEAAGVTRMMTIGAGDGISGTRAAVALATAHPGRIFASAGVHPHDAGDTDDALWAELETLAQDPAVRAIGETGLDDYYDHAPRAAQEEAFRRQIALARKVRKPIIIHTRNAPEDTLRILAEEDARDVGGVIHCFSENADFARKALDLGFALAFGGLVTFPKGTDGIREAAKIAPAEALLVETDAPYLAPIPHRGKRNEPALVAETARFLAELRGVPEGRLREETTRNACRILQVTDAA